MALSVPGISPGGKPNPVALADASASAARTNGQPATSTAPVSTPTVTTSSSATIATPVQPLNGTSTDPSTNGTPDFSRMSSADRLAYYRRNIGKILGEG